MTSNLRFPKVLLINLPGTIQDGYKPSPLGILYLASYLRQNIPNLQVDIVDGAISGSDSIFQKISRFRPDLVGLSVMTPGRIEAVSIAKKIKTTLPHCKIVLGGVHPSIMWQQMMRHFPVIDYIVKGEGEIVLSELVKNIPLSQIKGLVWRKPFRIINNPSQKLIQSLDNIPFPAWDLINVRQYPPRGQGIVNGIDLEKEVRVPIIFSRGCMGSCTFCSTWKIWHGYRYRTGLNVAKEISFLVKNYHVKHFVFQDDTLTGNRQEIVSFCRKIIRLKLHIAITGCTRVDHVDLSLLKLMKKAGFYELSYGIESGSPKILKKINKNTDIEKNIFAATNTKKAGIKFTALMMSNLPSETENDKKLSQQLIAKLKPDNWSTLGCVWIFPGTALFQQAKNANIISESFWLSQRPYYVYRGGIDQDPIQYEALIDDWYQTYKNTIMGKIVYRFLSLGNQKIKHISYNNLRKILSI